jgi:hypothetical protein
MIERATGRDRAPAPTRAVSPGAGAGTSTSWARRDLSGVKQLRTRQGRRAAFRETRHELDAERGGGQAAELQEPVVELDPDRERLVNSQQGRRGWMREARHQLDEKRRQQVTPRRFQLSSVLQ